MALITLISALDEQFSRTLWAFQSYVFYENPEKYRASLKCQDEFTLIAERVLFIFIALMQR